MNRFKKYLPVLSVNDPTTRTIIFYSSLLILIFPLLTSKIRANDTWKALYMGRYLELFHKFPHHSTFTFSPVRDFVLRDNYTWLGNLIFYNIHHYGNFLSLQLLRALILILTILILHSLINFRTSYSLLALFLLFSYSLDQKLHLRISIFAIPMTVSIFWIWNRAANSNSKYLWLYVPLLTLWANLHASYVLGLILLFILFAGKFTENLTTDKDLSTSTKGLGILYLIIIFSTTFIKPFPDKILLDQFNSFSKLLFQTFSGGFNISSLTKLLTGGFVSAAAGIENEFILGKGGFQTTLSILHLPLVQYSISISLILFFLFFTHRNKTESSFYVIFLLIMILGLRFIRVVSYMSLSFTPIILILLNQNNSIFFTNTTKILSIIIILIFSFFLLHCLFNYNVYRLTGNPRLRIGKGKIQLFSNSIPNFVLKNYSNKKILHGWGEGTYLTWRWWPFKKVYIDSRGAPYTNAFLKNYDNENRLKWKFDYVVLWKSRKKLNFYRQSPKWIFVAKDGSMAFYKRKNT